MPTAEMEAIKKELNDINRFVRDRIDPVTKEVDLLREESERLKEEVLRIRQHDRALRRDAVMRHAEEHESIVVPEGPYAGMDVLDLAPAAPVRPLPAPRVVWPGMGRARRGREAHPGRRADPRRHPGLSPRLRPKAGGMVLGRPQVDRTV